MSEDCCRYGTENINDNTLAKAAAIYGDARKHVEKEQEDLNQQLFSQVNFFMQYMYGINSVLFMIATFCHI